MHDGDCKMMNGLAWCSDLLFVNAIDDVLHFIFDYFLCFVVIAACDAQFKGEQQFGTGAWGTLLVLHIVKSQR